MSRERAELKDAEAALTMARARADAAAEDRDAALARAERAEAVLAEPDEQGLLEMATLLYSPPGLWTVYVRDEYRVYPTEAEAARAWLGEAPRG